MTRPLDYQLLARQIRALAGQLEAHHAPTTAPERAALTRAMHRLMRLARTAGERHQAHTNARHLSLERGRR